MVKHTQTIRQQIADELFECVRPFYEIGTKGFKSSYFQSLYFALYLHPKCISNWSFNNELPTVNQTKIN